MTSSNWRLWVAGLFLVLSVVVDFASWILSVTADAAIVGAAIYFIWPAIIASGEENQTRKMEY